MAKYLYNGVEFPALPEYDSAKYPYVFIVGNVSSTTGEVSYSFVCCDNPLVYKKPLLQTEFVVSVYGNGGQYNLKENEWVLWSMDKELSHYYFQENFNFLWSNHDIINQSDGTLYLAASDPVPVLSWNGKDAYAVINGSWVKCDVVKPTDGKWVTQDSYS